MWNPSKPRSVHHHPLDSRLAGKRQCLALLALAALAAACAESPAEPAAPEGSDLIYLHADDLDAMDTRSFSGAAVERGLSTACSSLNNPFYDGLYFQLQAPGRVLFAGEALTVAAALPIRPELPLTMHLRIRDRSTSALVADLTTAFPGTLSFTFPKDGTYDLLWQTSENNATWTVSCGKGTLPLAIDVKPGGDPNTINLRSKGFVPVALLGSAWFDVSDVNVSTLAFGPNGARPTHDLSDPAVWYDHTHEESCDETCAWEELDVNGDGHQDLVGHYRIDETGLAPADTEACLTGRTRGGRAFEACDAVNVRGG